MARADGAETLRDRAVSFELEDGVHLLDLTVRRQAINAKSTAATDGHRTRLVAADQRPDAFTVDVHVHGCWRAHLPSAWKLRPLASGNARAAAVRPGPSPDGTDWAGRHDHFPADVASDLLNRRYSAENRARAGSKSSGRRSPASGLRFVSVLCAREDLRQQLGAAAQRRSPPLGPPPNSRRFLATARRRSRSGRRAP